MRPAAARVFGLLIAVLLGLLVVAPDASAWPVGTDPSAAIDMGAASPGDAVTVTVEHTTPGDLTMEILLPAGPLDPVVIGTAVVAADGTGAVIGRVPDDATGGFHVIRVSGAGGEQFLWDLEVLTTTTFPNVGFSYTCTGPDVARIDATFAIATVGLTYRVTLTARGQQTPMAVVEREATTTSFVVSVTIATPPVALFYEVTDGSGTSAGTIVVRCDEPPTSGSPSASAGPVVTDGGASLAATGAQVGAGVVIGLACLLVGMLLTSVARRRAGAHRA